MVFAAASILSAPAAVATLGATKASAKSLPMRTAATAKRAALTRSAAIDRHRPTAPSSLSVSAASVTAITLSWAASRDDVGVRGYSAYLDKTRVGSTATRSFRFSKLRCGLTYQLGVDAFDASGKRSKIVTILAATAPCLDITPPTAPPYLRQAGGGASGVPIEWGAAADNVAVAGYSVYRDGVPIATTQQTSLWLGSLVCGAGYSLAVEAYDAAGNRSPRTAAVVTTDACRDTTPPTSPHGLFVSASTVAAISVTWQPSSDDRGVAGYRTFVDDRDGGSTTATSKTFDGLQCGVSSTVKIVAFDAAGNESPPAATVVATSPCPPLTGSSDQQSPTTPNGVAQTGSSTVAISLAWNPSTDNVGVVGYGIYRNGAKVADAAATARSFTAGGLVCATSYELAVDAVDASGNRSARKAIMAATSGCTDGDPPPPPTDLAQLGKTETTITLGWTASGGGVTGYRQFSNGAQVGSTTATSYVFTGLTCGTSYTLAVEALDAAGNTSPRSATMLSTSACSDTMPPTSPGPLQNTGSTTTSLALSWGAATDNVGVSGYRLYLDGTLVGTTQQTSYSFAALTCATSYTIDVEAFDTAGNHSPRTSLAATTATCGSPQPPPSDSTPSTSTANLFVVASGGSASCTRSPTLVSYDQAASGGNVCGPGTRSDLGYPTTAWNNACKAASLGNTPSGTIVGVKAGTYAQGSSDGHLVKDTDCSGGLGADVNPNAEEQNVATGTTAAWVKFVCADGDAKNVRFNIGGLVFMFADFHLVVQGPCFDFNTTVNFGAGGGSAAQRTSNVQLIGGDGCATDPKSSDCMGMYGLEVKGAKNILLENINYGPSLICAKNDPLIPVNFRCDPSGPEFEARFAAVGGEVSGCTGDNTGPWCGGWFGVREFIQAYIHNGDQSTYTNIRVEDFYFHDSNTRFSGSGVHPGCFMMDNNVGGMPSHNLVFDHLVCERVATVGIQQADSGVTIQNSIFSAPTFALDQSSPLGRWDDPSYNYQLGMACRADQVPGCNVSNVLIRYNVFLTGGRSSGLLLQTGGKFGGFSNVRVVGNVFGASLTCGVPGVTYDSNTFQYGTAGCGTNATSLPAGDPFIQSSIATPNGAWSAVSLLDAHPSGSPALPSISIAPGSDLDLVTDADGAARSGTTRPGAYD